MADRPSDTASLSRRTIGNATALTVGTAAETALQLIFLVIAGRELGPQEFGFYGVVLSVLTFALVTVQFGLPSIAVREIAQRPVEEEHVFAAAFRIRAGLAALFFVAALIAGLLVPLPAVHRWAVWLMFAYLLFVPFDLSFLFDAHLISRWDVPGKLAGRVTSVALLVSLWLSKGKLTVADVGICSSVLMLVNVVVGWRIAKGLRLSLRPFAATRQTGPLARMSLPILWSNVLTTTFTQGYTILVRTFSGTLETGFYALGNRLMMPVLVVKGTLYRLLLPILSETGTNREAMVYRLERVLPSLALIFMPSSVLLIVAAEVLIVPVFGQAYAGAVRPFQISVGALFFSGMASAFGTTLVAAGDARTPTIGLTVGTALSLALCWLLIPRHGAVGAAWAAIVGDVASCLYALPAFLRRWRPAVLGRVLRIASSSLAGLLAFCGLRAASDNWMAKVAAMLAAIVVTAIGLWMSREISRERLESLLNLIRKTPTAGQDTAA
jgi:O-antigen/teichoic acid export membrane protein